MRGEHYSEQQDKFLQLAERAHDLWGRILVTQVDTQESVLLETRTAQATQAWGLFEKALGKATNLSESVPPKTVKKPKSAPAPEKQKAIRLSDEALAEYTQFLLNKMRVDVRGSGETDEIAKVELKAREAEKREFIAGNTPIHIKHGDEQFEKEARNRFILEQDDLDQVVLWTAQAGGPRQAPFRQRPEDRVSFVDKMINLGRLDENAGGEDREMDDETLWEHFNEAAKQGLLTGAEDPKITVRGFQHLQELLQSDQVEDTQAHIFGASLRR